MNATSTTQLPRDGGALVGRRWPAAVATPAMAAAYDGALEGLDPRIVAEVVASLSSKGRAAPPPGILRAVVLSHQESAATTITVLADALPDPVGADDSRAGSFAALLIAGLGLALAAALTGADWMSVAEAGRTTGVSGSDVRGGRVVALAGLLALLAAAAGILWLWRRSPVARVRSALGLLAAAGVAAVFGAMTGVMRVSEVGNRVLVDAGSGAGGVAPDLQSLVTVSTAPAAWAALGLSLVAVAASLYGLLTHRGA